MSVDGSPNLVYPAPRLPMVGKYLVRKRYVAKGLRAIDLACSAFGRSASTAAPDQGEKIRSIVFAQCGHFGDLIMTLPTLHWVRQNRPEMRIGLIVGSWARPMMGGISALFDASYFADHFMLNRSRKSSRNTDKVGRWLPRRFEGMVMIPRSTVIRSSKTAFRCSMHPAFPCVPVSQAADLVLC